VIACPGSLMTLSHVLLPSSYLITDTHPEEYPTASVAGSNRPLHHDSDDTPIFSFDDDGNDDAESSPPPPADTFSSTSASSFQ